MSTPAPTELPPALLLTSRLRAAGVSPPTVFWDEPDIDQDVVAGDIRRGGAAGIDANEIAGDDVGSGGLQHNAIAARCRCSRRRNWQ